MSDDASNKVVAKDAAHLRELIRLDLFSYVIDGGGKIDVQKAQEALKEMKELGDRLRDATRRQIADQVASLNEQLGSLG